MEILINIIQPDTAQLKLQKIFWRQKNYIDTTVAWIYIKKITMWLYSFLLIEYQLAITLKMLL